MPNEPLSTGRTPEQIIAEFSLGNITRVIEYEQVRDRMVRQFQKHGDGAPLCTCNDPSYYRRLTSRVNA